MTQREHKKKSKEMSVIVIIHGAKNLPSRDWESESDPYVKVSFRGINHEEFQTDFLTDNPNPVWRTENAFYITSSKSTIKNNLEGIDFTVNDYDAFKKDDKIGDGLLTTIYEDRKKYTLENSQIQEVQLYRYKELAGKLFVQVFVVKGPVKEETKNKIAIKRAKHIFGSKITTEQIEQALEEEPQYNKKVKHKKMKMLKYYVNQFLSGYEIRFEKLDLKKKTDSCTENILTFTSNAFCFLFTLAGLPGAWKAASKIGNRLLKKLTQQGLDGIKAAIRAYKEARNSSIMKRAKKLWDVYQKVNEHIEWGKILKDIRDSWNTKEVIGKLIICGLTVASWFISGAAGFFIQCLLALPDAVGLAQCAVKTIDSCRCNDNTNKKHETQMYQNNNNYQNYQNQNYQNYQNYNYQNQQYQQYQNYQNNNFNNFNNNNNFNTYISKLTIHITRGINLKDLDTGINDKSDPYVKVTCYGLYGEKFETEVIDNNLNPYWNEKFTVKDENNFEDLSSIQFEVYDHDRITKDDKIGSYTVDNPSQKNYFQRGRSKTQRVELQYKNKKNRGQLEFKLTFE